MARFKVEGLKELDAALGEFSKATGRNILRRALSQAAEPIRSAAAAKAPVDRGALQQAIIVTAKGPPDAGKVAYARVMKSGGDAKAATAALRQARRDNAGQNAFAEVFIGPDKSAFYGRFQEFGTVHHAPQPFMRPAFDENAQAALDLIAGALSEQIEKARARAARKTARLAAKG